MALRLNQIRLPLPEGEDRLVRRVARLLAIAPQRIANLRVVRQGIDARGKPRIVRVFTVDFECDDEEGLLKRWRSNRHLERAPEPASTPALIRCRRPFPVLVAGMGPAGLFAAWRLAQGGAKVTLIERGSPVEERLRDVEGFWREGKLDPESNVQFGEGGAGTFSDGKLTCRIGGPWVPLVLRALVECGAPEEILVQAKPHIGTDRLRGVLVRLRRLLSDLGVEIRFRTRLTGLLQGSEGVRGGVVDSGEELYGVVVLACGHSARDTCRMLHETGVFLESKPFAMGLRVEHPAELINALQWGAPSIPGLGAADYRLACNNPQTGRGSYSFCMCPGGEVIAACSEAGRMVVNGMSRHSRAGAFSNSALVVTVKPEDFGSSHPLAGIDFQRQWEEQAFRAGGGDYRAPAQNLLSFLGTGGGAVRSTVRPGFREADLRAVLPSFAAEELQGALSVFNRSLPGFVSGEATLIGVESRTSAPFRITRGADGASLSHPGLYPAGEGAGYAGGIVSSAVDGLKTADLILKKENGA